MVARVQCSELFKGVRVSGEQRRWRVRTVSDDTDATSIARETGEIFFSRIFVYLFRIQSVIRLLGQAFQ